MLEITCRALWKPQASGNTWKKSWGHQDLQVLKEGWVPRQKILLGAADVKAQDMSQ